MFTFVRFTKQDAFVGYQNDTPASVVFQATQQLQQEWDYHMDYQSIKWMKAVLARSKKILLQMASPDALIRLQNSPLDDRRERLSQIYYIEQHHGSIVDFLCHHLHSNHSNGLLIQVYLIAMKVYILISCMYILLENVFHYEICVSY